MKPKRIKRDNLKNKSVLRHAKVARFKDKDYSEPVSELRSIVALRGFGSSRKYVKAVSKLYSRELNDIDRFVHFAESLSAEK
jgi:hypothetical protein